SIRDERSCDGISANPRSNLLRVIRPWVQIEQKSGRIVRRIPCKPYSAVGRNAQRRRRCRAAVISQGLDRILTARKRRKEGVCPRKCARNPPNRSPEKPPARCLR